MSKKELAGKVALVTGASRGLGEAMALALADAGAAVALAARSADRLQAVAQKAISKGLEAEAFPCDVTDESQVVALQERVMTRFKQVHILINNAGVNVRKPVPELALAEWRYVLDTNLTAAFLLCRTFVPQMKKAGYGRIINVASIMSHVALPGRAAYAASKAGLLGLTRALALELASLGITVNSISPGPVATEMNTVITQDPELNQQFISRIPLGRWGSAEEIAGLAVYLCSPKAAFVTGADFLIDGGWTVH
jgi:NAD(P)-dependent dehydrogenase (short-subunit alcohol dehydrogenase family)